MKPEELINDDQLLIVTIARNNPEATRKNLEPYNSFAPMLTQKGIVESVFILHQKNPNLAWHVLDVPWRSGSAPEIDDFVLQKAGQGSTLVRAVHNFKLYPYLTVQEHKIDTKLPDPDIDWTVIFAFIMAMIVLFVWTKTSKK